MSVFYPIKYLVLSFTLSPFIRVNKCVLNTKRVAGPGLDTGDSKVVQMQSCPQGTPRAKVNRTLTHESQALHGFYPIHTSQDSASRVGGGVGGDGNFGKHLTFTVTQVPISKGAGGGAQH